MITAIGTTSVTRSVDTVRSDVVKRNEAAPKATTTTDGEAAAPASPAAQMVAAGPPIDTDKVAAIRTALSEGRYAVDPQKIADRMIALDLPAKG